MRTIRAIFLALPFLALSGCDKEEQIPAYLRIENYTFTSDPQTQGSSSSKVVDAWVTVGGSFIGTFEMPVSIPVLKADSQEVYVFAGVMENGISTTRNVYPFYSSYRKKVLLKAAEFDTIKPEFNYTQHTKLSWLENFESFGFSLTPGFNNEAQLRITTHPDTVFEGNGSFCATVSQNDSFMLVESQGGFTFTRGKAVWLELDYKTDTRLEIGLKYTSASGNQTLPKVIVKTLPHWNKIYVNFTNNIAEAPADAVFRFYFRAYHDKNSPDQNILLDNLKVLRLE